MTPRDVVGIVVFTALVLLAAVPLGRWMAALFLRPEPGRGPLARVESAMLRLARIDPARAMGWREYAAVLLLVNAIGFAVTLAVLLLQHRLPWNPRGLAPMRFDLAFNTAVSFVTNTNWQAYSGEAALSPLAQALALGSQNFLSAATGLAGLAALARAFVRDDGRLGNAWVDLTRATVRLLLPLAAVFALLLVQQGVPQTLAAELRVGALDPSAPGAAASVPVGPVASQVAIKQLGTNGGGFYGANSAHPFENPTPASNLLELLAILALPAGCCLAFGRMVGDRRQGVALLLASTLLVVPAFFACVAAERRLPEPVAALGVASDAGYLEGKEVRFGVLDSALWATATTAASNGSVNAMHDSFTPLGGLVPLVLMLLGEVAFGGVGSGLYGLVLFALVAVFVSGLMVGRTPEYLGKKVESFEMKMVCLGLLLPSAFVLVGTAAGVVTDVGRASMANPGAHGFTEVLYALASASNNNGSAFAGLGVDQPFWNWLLAAAMVVGRFGVLVPVLALAGSLARKRALPRGAGTLPTHGATFVLLLLGVVLLVGALSYVPAFVLGPIVEHLGLAR